MDIKDFTAGHSLFLVSSTFMEKVPPEVHTDVEPERCCSSGNVSRWRHNHGSTLLCCDQRFIQTSTVHGQKFEVAFLN